MPQLPRNPASGPRVQMPMKRSPLVSGLVALALAIFVLGCATGSGPSPSPGPAETPPVSPSPAASPIGSPDLPPSPTPPPGSSPAPLTVESPAQAAALVLESDPRFLGIGPPLVELVGQCCWYQAHEAVEHYLVTVEIGWGDCPSGCIESHRWLYRVDLDGTLSLLEQGGDEPVQREPSTGTGSGALLLTAVAGPTCPVGQVPADPACAPRPVAGTELVVFNARGTEVERALTDDQGRVIVELPAGAYYVEGMPAEGLMREPQPAAISVGPGDQAFLVLEYDTRIR